MTAIRPPDYFPSLATCALMLAAERFVVADTLAFSRQSWHNRTKIRTSDAKGWQWLSIPRAHGGVGRPLCELAIDESTTWRRTHLRALQVNYEMAPFYDWFVDDIESLIGQPHSSVGALTVASVKWLHSKVGAPSELIIASEMPGKPDSLQAIWAATEHRNGLLTIHEALERDRSLLPDATVEPFYFTEQERTQNFPGFVSGLSALDLLMNHGAG